MRRIIRLIFAAFLLGGWLLAAASLHVLVLPGGNFGLLPKDRLGFTDTYVDTRNWTPDEAAKHPALMKRLVDAGRVDWLSSVFGTPGETSDAALKHLLETGAPEPDRKPAPAVRDAKSGR